MKTQILFLLLIIVPGLVFGQSKSVKDLRHELEDRRDVTTVHVNGALIKIAGALAEFSDEDDEEVEAFAKAAKDITSIDIININNERAFDDEERSLFIKNLKKEGYEELVKVREKDKNMTVYSFGDDVERLKDVVIVSDDWDDFSIISINGVISMKELNILID